MSVTDWSTQPSNNASIDAGIQAQDGAPSTTVSNSFRNLMARVASLALDGGGALTTSGTGNTYTVTTNGVVGVLKAGVSVTVRANRTNTAAPLLNIDGKGALQWFDTAGDPQPAGAIEPGVLYMVAWIPAENGQPPSWRTLATTGSVLTERQLSGTPVKPLGAMTALPIDDYLRGLMPAAAFGIVADAVLNADGTLQAGTDQTAKLNAYFQYCHNNDIRPRLPRGRYLVLGSVLMYDSGDYDGTFVAPNQGFVTGSTTVAMPPVIQLVPDPNDVTRYGEANQPAWSTVEAEVKAWTSTFRGSAKIRNMKPDRKGQCITVDTASQPLLGRLTFSALRMGQTFYVNDTEGNISHRLMADWDTSTWNSGTFRAEDVRNRIAVTLPSVILYGPANGQRNAIVTVSRSNTDVYANDIRNLSGGPVRIGLSVARCCWVRLFTPTCDDLQVDEQNYGVGLDLASGVEIFAGASSGCRRGFDATRAVDVAIHGGTYPDGIGAHYIWGLKVIGANIGCSNSANPQALQFTGGDLSFHNCAFTVSQPAQTPIANPALFRVRGDLYECGGHLSFQGCTVDIDVTGMPVDPSLLDLSGDSGYDTLRDVEMPSNIFMDGSNTVRIRGTNAARGLQVFRLFRNFESTFTKKIITSGRVEISPQVAFDDGVTTLANGTARCWVELTKPAQSIGTGYDMRFRNFPGLRVEARTASSAAANGIARHDIEVERAQGPNRITTNNGILRRAVFLECSGEFTVPSGVPAYTSVGDEVRRIVPIDVPIESLVKTANGLAIRTLSAAPLELLDAPGQNSSWTLRGGVSGSYGPALSVTGSGASTNMDLIVKGNGGFQLKGFDGAVTGLVVPIVANGVNYPTMRGAASGSEVVYGATGAESTISVVYSARGTLGSAILGLNGQRVGFYGANGGQKQTVLGARGGNTALADLLTKLANLGLITDATTA